jgi:hypothetical protein
MRYPLDNFTVTQRFGDNPAYYGPGGHTGIDLAAPEGTEVYTAVAGTVISVGTNPSYTGGLYVIIRQDGGDRYEFYTGHHSHVYVSTNQKVTEGQKIALVGHTGDATGPHVHFQIRQFNYGALVNPDDVFGQITEGDKVNDKVTVVGATASVTDSYNNIHVFARGSDDSLWHKWFDSRGWQDWEKLSAGSVMSSPTANAIPGGHIHVFATGPAGDLMHWWFNENGWNGAESLGIPKGNI